MALAPWVMEDTCSLTVFWLNAFRQSIAEQRTAGELDVKDSGQDAVTGAQVDAVLKRQLQFEGCFLNPEKYDPVKPLGRGGQAKVHLVNI